MTLARHKDPKLTMRVYGRAQLHDLAGAVGGLPDLLGSASAPYCQRWWWLSMVIAMRVNPPGCRPACRGRALLPRLRRDDIVARRRPAIVSHASASPGLHH